MNIENIKLFVLTFQKGNFAAVAKHLNVSPSSVSRAVANLEHQLKTRLFQRNTRTLTPTLAGSNYYQHVLPLLDELEGLHQNITQGSNEPVGVLRVNASTSYGQIVLKPLIKPFCEQYKNIKLELHLSDTKTDLIEQQIDVAIRHGHLSDSTLIARKMHDVTYYLVASPDYLSSANPINQPEDINEHQIITFSYEEFAKQWHFSSGSISKSITLRSFLTISSAVMIKECLLEGMGISLLADWTIQGDLKSGRLVRVLPQWSVSGENLKNSVWAIQASKALVPRKTSTFIDFMLARLNV
jgi:DNA-binding transcriptional LysR family regulator